MTTPVERVPPRDAVLVVAAVALVAVVPAASAVLVLPLAALGAAVLVVGAARGTGAAVSVGGALLAVAALLAGVLGASAVAVLAGAVTAVVAWDAGWTAIDLGVQLGEAARVERVLGRHVLTTAVVGGGLAAGGYGVYRVATGGQPVAALLALLAAAVLLAVALD